MSTMAAAARLSAPDLDHHCRYLFSPHLQQRGPMLSGYSSIATVAVKDLPAAKKFYAETLGLTPVHEEGEEAVSFRTGDSSLIVYRSQFAGSNKATACNWQVGSAIDSIVKGLEAKGVKFEHYDMPGMKREGSIHIAGPMRIAWFKDPDGNIHALMA
jgi:catechol 2,3-dioxygenase-like lactoylglutathione lyase family enzyme